MNFPNNLINEFQTNNDNLLWLTCSSSETFLLYLLQNCVVLPLTYFKLHYITEQ